MTTEDRRPIVTLSRQRGWWWAKYEYDHMMLYATALERDHALLGLGVILGQREEIKGQDDLLRIEIKGRRS